VTVIGPGLFVKMRAIEVSPPARIIAELLRVRASAILSDPTVAIVVTWPEGSGEKRTVSASMLSVVTILPSREEGR
jgi:hypothetical protein